jgi:hypothetical protein
MDDKKQALAARFKWAIAALACIIVAPFVFLLVQGIVGLAVAALIGAAAIAAAPVVSMKLANWKLKGLKQEARQNPIESRQNIALQARERIRVAEQELTTLATEIRGFADMVAELRQSQPDDALAFEDQLKGLQTLLTARKNGIAAARQRADEFDAATQRAARKWKVAQAAIRMQKLSGAQEDDAMNKLLAEESLDSVQTAMNRALSELDTLLAAEVPRVPHNSSPTIDVHAVEIRERLGAR